MADTKISALTAIDALASGDLFAVVDDPAGTPASKKATINQVQDYIEAANNLFTGANTFHPTSDATAVTARRYNSGATSDILVVQDHSNNVLAAFDKDGKLTVPGATVSSGSLTLSGNISSAAWTTNGIRYKNAAATLTDTSSSGTVAAAYTNVFGGNTIAASNSTTFTDYYTTFITEPTAGTNVTFTNKWALGLSGNLKVTGNVTVTGTLTASNMANGRSLGRFTPLDNQPPASNFATLDTRNSVATLDFDDGNTNEEAVFVGVIPQGATLTSGIKVRIFWAATSATSGNCRWGVQFEKYGTDIDSDSFDTATEAHTATSGTSGIVVVTEITCTTIDSLVAGDQFRVKVYRDSSDTTNDTMTGDAELIAVELQQVA